MTDTSPSRFLPVLGLALALPACWTGQPGVVRQMAASDMRCTEDQLRVVRLDDVEKDRLNLTDSALYKVEGCGRRSFYLCEGWDSYQQKSVCEPSDAHGGH